MARKKMTSPAGVAVWPWLNEPDTRWDTSEYKVTLKVNAEDAKLFIECLASVYKEGYAAQSKELNKPKLKKANMPWSEVVDDQGNATGEVEFKFKNKSSYEYEGKTVETRVLLVDKSNHPVEGRVGSGSEIKIGFEPYVWYVPSMGVGITLRLKAVQVLNLVEFGGSNASDEFDFEFEEPKKAASGNEDPFAF
ncbi:MAG: putative helix-destabilizing protein [Prokaryotic dsDNA virus sp.]|nr:MAG: putative helix-destabilizing protein [Prokaryotic dsDNA virus sp.]|tara:strand:- start:22751 stop:23329 length:579 start_codon:yes stop_codon:yes gene_type:complete